VGKHETGYARIARDFYPTPSWVTNALLEFVDVRGKHIWECACGDGQMSEPLKMAGARVLSSDIVDRGYSAFDLLYDFMSFSDPMTLSWDGIITNPPYGTRGKLAETFI
jgi:predicted RNA methylase